ncbi:hypothetical protein [Candidatus Ichthyocystis hellenicum]|uniref:hypothetical protein n=1 Tax=Candidatus Ichthyocystis hellenicum TaxID=1561003 RepID=UPI000B88D7F0|nr:hypothetical protein [Candidatus Ichthyocystis hellenicum]
MNKISTTNPLTLLELSSGAIFGFSCEESIGQISTKDIIKASVLVEHKQLNLSKYESILDLEHDDNHQFSYSDWNKITCSDCNNLSYYDDLYAIEKFSKGTDTIIRRNHSYGDFLCYLPTDNAHWSSHPLYQVIYNKDSQDIIKNYYENRNRILSLPILSSQIAKAPITERVFYYLDPLFF